MTGPETRRVQVLLLLLEFLPVPRRVAAAAIEPRSSKLPGRKAN